MPPDDQKEIERPICDLLDIAIEALVSADRDGIGWEDRLTRESCHRQGRAEQPNRETLRLPPNPPGIPSREPFRGRGLFSALGRAEIGCLRELLELGVDVGVLPRQELD